MKKDFLSNGAKLMGMLFLFFFSFTASELSAQTTDLSPGLTSLVNNGVRYDVDKMLSQHTFVPATEAAVLYTNAANNADSALSVNQDDDASYNLLSLKRDLYKSIAYQLQDGQDVSIALKATAFSINDYKGKYWNSNSNLQQPDAVALFQEVVQIAIQ